VLVIARNRGRSCQRDDGVTVFARVEGELRRGQLAALPALVERVLQDVPALPGLVDPGAKLHLAPSFEEDPARILAWRVDALRRRR
jgi:hypothetical protein